MKPERKNEMELMKSNGAKSISANSIIKFKFNLIELKCWFDWSAINDFGYVSMPHHSISLISVFISLQQFIAPKHSCCKWNLKLIEMNAAWNYYA